MCLDSLFGFEDLISGIRDVPNSFGLEGCLVLVRNLPWSLGLNKMGASVEIDHFISDEIIIGLYIQISASLASGLALLASISLL